MIEANTATTASRLGSVLFEVSSDAERSQTHCGDRPLVQTSPAASGFTDDGSVK